MNMLTFMIFYDFRYCSAYHNISVSSQLALLIINIQTQTASFSIGVWSKQLVVVIEFDSSFSIGISMLLWQKVLVSFVISTATFSIGEATLTL